MSFIKQNRAAKFGYALNPPLDAIVTFITPEVNFHGTAVFKKVATFNIDLFLHHVKVIEHTKMHLGYVIVISYAKQ